MILIVGSTHDDVLYFESKLRNKSEELLFGKFPYVVGTMFSQQIGVVYGAYTNYLSSIITSTILAKNYVVLVINVGKCSAFSPSINSGDIVISRQAFLGEVNQVGVEDAILGQVPTCPPFYTPDAYVLQLMNECFNKIVKKSILKFGTYISIEKNVNSKEAMAKISSNSGIVFGNKDDIVVDCVTGGVALATYLQNIPFISVEVVDGQIDQKRSISHYVEVLKQYSDLGKAVTSFIGEISRNEVISGSREQ